MRHLWDSYWAWTGGNVGAMPLQALITGVTAFIFRGPLGRFLGRDEAKAARRIMADLHLKLTGEAHPDAPAHGPESGAE